MDATGLVQYYEQELAFLRQSGEAFAQAHPSIAAGLSMQGGTTEDPHVTRLIQSFAFLNARIQQRLDDDIPEVTDALLERLYPHTCLPIPAMSIVQCQPDQDLDHTVTLAPGTQLETESVEGRPCYFRTAYPVNLHPFHISQASFLGQPLVTPGAQALSGAKSVLQVHLAASAPAVDMLSALASGVRFHLAGERCQAYALQRLLFSRCLGVVVSQPGSAVSPVILSPEEAVAPVGFSADEGLLPFSPDAFLGYRLLSEFFVFPEKFLFFNLDGVHDAVLSRWGAVPLDQLCVSFYFSEAAADLEHSVDVRALALGCTPVINLFEQRAEPIVRTQTHYDMAVIPDARHPDDLEVYRVENVTALDAHGQPQPCLPLYGQKYVDLKQAQQHAPPPVYWQAKRQMQAGGGGEVRLHLSDQAGSTMAGAAQVLDVHTLCFNGDLPAKLMGRSPGLPLFLSAVEAPVARIRFLAPPTRCIRPPLGQSARWRLVSHLSLNHLQLSAEAGRVERLKALLSLYNVTQRPGASALVEAVVDVQVSPTVAPLMLEGRAAMCRGTHIEVVVDGSRLRGHSAYGLGAVLDRFFEVYTPVNTFTQFSLRLAHAAEPLHSWPPRMGARSLV